MKVTVKTRKKVASGQVPALLHADAKPIENGGVEWSLGNAVSLSKSEIDALKRKHKSQCPNLARATEVKKLMQQGKSRKAIVILLRSKYKERMISADHATLSAVGEGVKK